jgi:serine/threonine protein kinase
MVLSRETRFGRHEIRTPIGTGGMGEVCRAKYPKLAREVANKILPAALAQDPDHLACEAKMLASLNHLNVAQIYEIEDRALIMELANGETVREPVTLTNAF